MNRRTIMVAAGLAVVIIIGAVAVLFNTVLRAPAAASGSITAVPLALATPAPAAPTEALAQPVAAAPTAPVAQAAGQPTRFQIVQAGTKASFTLDELLRGQPTTVVGSTDQVAGELLVDPSDLSSAQIGPITINARTLATDSDMRDRAIKNFILNTDSYELISFTPTAISGLSGSGAPGTPYSFTIAGDLTIRDKTMPVVFEATVTAESASRLSGSASTTVNRADFGLQIPDVPSVANVSEQVKLEISFVAEAA